jgi:sulfur carrier protein ThiS
VESVEIIIVGNLKRQLGGEERLLAEPAQSVQALLEELQLSPRSMIAVVNGRRVPKTYVLRPDDKVKLLRPVAGG